MQNHTWARLSTSPASHFGWLICFGSLLLPSLCLALSTKLALVDDVWCATRTGVFGNQGLLGFVETVFNSGDLRRFRWSYELEQNMRWLLFGPCLAAHHFVVWCYRLMTAGFACLLVRKYVKLQMIRCSIAAYYMPVAYGLFFPIVPECRLGLQEPLFSLLLLFALYLLLCQCDDLNARHRNFWCITIALIALSGAKEPAVLVACLLFCFQTVLSFKRTPAHVITTALVALLLLYSISRVLLVAHNDSYSSGQGNLHLFNVGWFCYRLRQTFVDILMQWRSGLPSLTAICILFWVAGALRLSRDLLTQRRPLALLLFAVFGLLLLLIAQMRPALRYAEPLVWVTAVIMGLGMAQLEHSWNTSLSTALACAAMIALVIGNYVPFASQFACQASVQDMHDRFLTELTRRLNQDGVDEVVIFGIGNAGDTGIRRWEPAILLKIFLEEYQPLFLARNRPLVTQPTIRGIPIEQLKHVRPGLLLVGMVTTEELNHECPNIQVELLASINVSEDSAGVRWHRWLVDFYKRFHLPSSAADWTDAGSPGSIVPKEFWHIWRIIDVR